MKNRALLFKLLLVQIFLSPLVGFHFAQADTVITDIVTMDKTITGTVTDVEGNPLIGVNVLIKDSDLGTSTDLDGKFELSIPDTAKTLIFSYIGYENLEININNQTEFNIQLEEDAQQLDEVVVTALNIKRQKRELGYSTENFGGDEIQLSNAPNIVNALSGKSAGVQITSPNGVDGGTTRITIRGNNNINGNRSFPGGQR